MALQLVNVLRGVCSEVAQNVKSVNLQLNQLRLAPSLNHYVWRTNFGIQKH